MWRAVVVVVVVVIAEAAENTVVQTVVAEERQGAEERRVEVFMAEMGQLCHLETNRDLKELSQRHSVINSQERDCQFVILAL